MADRPDLEAARRIAAQYDMAPVLELVDYAVDLEDALATMRGALEVLSGAERDRVPHWWLEKRWAERRVVDALAWVAEVANGALDRADAKLRRGER